MAKAWCEHVLANRHLNLQDNFDLVEREKLAGLIRPFGYEVTDTKFKLATETASRGKGIKQMSCKPASL